LKKNLDTSDIPDTPLTETDIEAVHGFLADLHGPIRSLEGLDGMLCALTCAPVDMTYNDYMPGVLGGDSFTDEDEARSIGALIERHQRTIEIGLHETLESETLYTPALLVDANGKARGNEWALGFLFGVAMTEGNWRDFTRGDHMAKLMLPMMVLAHEHHPDPKMRPCAIADDSRDELLFMMTHSLAIIYGHFNGKPVPDPDTTAPD
jgi:uncharacterized protein